MIVSTMRGGIATAILGILLMGLAACTPSSPAHSSEKLGLYGTYSLRKTTDYVGQDKLPNEELVQVTLNEDNTYEVVFESDSVSTGIISRDFAYETSDDFVLTYAMQMIDYRNTAEPSYVFYLRVELDASISLLLIPQGAGDNSWVQTADFWNLTKSE